MADIIRIYQAQTTVPADKQLALSLVEQVCTEAAEKGCDMVTLPEMFCCPYETSNFPLYAEPEDSAFVHTLADIAQSHKIWLSAGSMPELAPGGKIYNTAFVFDRSGHITAKHRKMHLFDIAVQGGQCFRESDTLSAGDQVTVFDTEFGKLGLCICYDLRFPELGRLMALQGARLILVPAAFNMTTGPAHWELTFRAQAVFNQVFTVGTAPACDMAASYHSWGHSIAVDPWGTVLSQADTSDCRTELALALSQAASVRTQLPLLQHRRTDIYRLETI